MRKALDHLGWTAPDDFDEEEMHLLFELLIKQQLSYEESLQLIRLLRKD
jgi:hypothetical protein